MKAFNNIFLVLLFVGHFSLAQTTQLRQFKDTIPGRYQFYSKQEFEKTMQNLRKNGEKNKSEREKLYVEYANEFVLFKKNLLQNGEIYFDWEELEGYLMFIAQKVLPAEFTRDSSFRIYINRDPFSNAFVGYDNAVYINIGLVADAKDEAEIAGIIAHEYGHLLHNHNFNNFVVWRRAMKASRSLLMCMELPGLLLLQMLRPIK